MAGPPNSGEPNHHIEEGGVRTLNQVALVVPIIIAIAVVVRVMSRL